MDWLALIEAGLATAGGVVLLLGASAKVNKPLLGQKLLTIARLAGAGMLIIAVPLLLGALK